MRTCVPRGTCVLAACIALAVGQLKADQPIIPLVELQSGPLTPGVMLDESPRPIHQIRVLVDAKLTRGTLILDCNEPKFDAFGNLVGGLRTPHIRGKGDPALVLRLDCSIELDKDGPDKWRLYRLRGPKLRTPLRIATRGSIADGGPTRLVFLDPGGKVVSVVRCTRYGLVIP